MSFALHCLSVYFAFHLLNCSDVMEPVRVRLYPRLPHLVSYMLGCSFCLTFWVTLGVALSGRAPWGWVLAAPVVNLLILKVITYLDRTS